MASVNHSDRNTLNFEEWPVLKRLFAVEKVWDCRVRNQESPTKRVFFVFAAALPRDFSGDFTFGFAFGFADALDFGRDFVAAFFPSKLVFRLRFEPDAASSSRGPGVDLAKLDIPHGLRHLEFFEYSKDIEELTSFIKKTIDEGEGPYTILKIHRAKELTNAVNQLTALANEANLPLLENLVFRDPKNRGVGGISYER
ncbi:hypothetical protein L1887_62324 [Cichorium endivia]|nr:hypothetical protein L1887_62324 [Cichorium endivia]